MSSSASNSKVADAPKEQAKETQLNLGVLEEDDEFEEFPVAGKSWCKLEATSTVASSTFTDWNDSETDLAHLGGAAPGAAKSGGDKLWEDNWDDDDIEDEFSVQLRWIFILAHRAPH